MSRLIAEAAACSPENTLPSFESGIDQGATSLETDTGVTTDGVSLIWHDQFLNPLSCRRQDGAPYTMENRVYIKDISMVDAQKTFICDKLRFGPAQKNDLRAIARSGRLRREGGSAKPLRADQRGPALRVRPLLHRLLQNRPRQGTRPAQRSTRPPARKCASTSKQRSCPNTCRPEAADTQGPNAPADIHKNHTVGPEVFIKTLCGEIVKANMVDRSDVQSFDFRTLQLVEQQYPDIPTYYLTESIKLLSSEFVPESLRLSPEEIK